MERPRAELLAPASGVEAVKAAIHAGADAVYTGGGQFGARAYAQNMTEDELLHVIDYVHLHGKRLYLTVNTLLKEKEIENALIPYIKPYYRQGLDAVIVQDIGVFRIFRKYFPDLSVHISTQAVVTGKNSARLWEEMGASRVVTARELSLEEIKDIRESTSLEIESFVHGALCYCYSGQCLFSSMLGERSGNRGRCAQPCRLPYELMDEKGKPIPQKKETSSDNAASSRKYLLSPKDMCTLDILPQIIEAGVYSLKIEGRMKRVEYTAGVTEIYRKYVDRYLECIEQGLDIAKEYRVEPADRERLLDLYNRGSFHSSYYQQHNGKNMMCLTRPNHNGVYIGVLKKEKNGYYLRTETALHKGDVLELRIMPGQQKNVSDTGSKNEHQFELWKDVRAGDICQIPVQYVRNSISQKSLEHMHIEIWRTKNEWLYQDIYQKYVAHDKKIPVQGEMTVAEGKPLFMKVSQGLYSCSVSGETVQSAKNQPIGSEWVRKQLEKTGNTPFYFESLNIQLDGNCFVAAKVLNQFRRKALEALERELLSPFRRDDGQILEDISKPVVRMKDRELSCKCHVGIENLEFLPLVLAYQQIDRVYISIHAFDLFGAYPEEGIKQLENVHRKCQDYGVKFYLDFPYIWRKDTEDRLEPYITWMLEHVDGALVKNMEAFAYLKYSPISVPIALDATAYAMNMQAVYAIQELGAASVTVPVELNAGEIRAFAAKSALPCELLVYGHIPMMVSAQCPIKNTTGCKHQPQLTRLKDRKGSLHFVRNYCDTCYSVIYNQNSLYLLDLWDEVRACGVDAVRLQFSVESEKEIAAVLTQFFGKEQMFDKEQHYTRGHWKRGVE